VRILTISNLYPPVVAGGYEARCAATMASLREQGHEVHVLTSTLRRGSCVPEATVLRELPFLPHGKASVLRAPLAAAQGMKVMRRVLADVRPDLIFVWNGAGIPHAALRVAELSGIPIAYSVGEHWFGSMYKSDPFVRYLLPGQRGARALWGRLVRLLNHLPALQVDPLTPARAAICWNSEATRRHCGIPDTLSPTLETVIYPGIPEPERWTSLERRPRLRPTIAYVGRVEEVKGPEVAYRALERLTSVHGIDARLELAGRCEPEMRARLDALAAELDVSDRVKLLGQVDKDGVGRVLERAHVLLVPSVWEEPFGLVLLEGALARIPVVASRSGGMPEALEEGSQALFFPIEDADACAAALAETLDHSSSNGAVAARVEAAYRRAQELSFERYVGEMGQFVADASASFSAGTRPVGSPV
jgi:glycosyltransferase involved in cell wall biosynthesis